MERQDERADGLIEELADANPVRTGALPEETDGIRTRVYAHATRSTSSGVGRARTLAFTGGGIAAAVVAGVVFGAIVLTGGGGNGGDGSAGPELPGGAGGGLSASCIGYSPEELRMRELAFAGTLTAKDGAHLTFAVEEALAGDPGESIMLEADHSLRDPMYMEFEFVEGERYLVSGDEVFAWGCGFTRPYSDELAAEWVAALADTRSPGASASCAFEYSPEALRERDHAFDGVVGNVEPRAIEGPGGIVYTRVTFEVREWFSAGEGETIALADAGMTLSEMYDPNHDGQGPQIGERYLVSGDDIFAWGCGFSHPYSEELAEEWRVSWR